MEMNCHPNNGDSEKNNMFDIVSLNQKLFCNFNGYPEKKVNSNLLLEFQKKTSFKENKGKNRRMVSPAIQLHFYFFLLQVMSVPTNERRAPPSKRTQFLKYYSESQRSLQLQQGELVDEDLKKILESDICIDIFWLSINNITEIGAEYLSKAKINLKQLYLSWNKLGSLGIKHISMAKWPKLTKIRLVSNDIGATGVKYITRANWKHLDELNLGMNNINNEGCRHLAKGDWKNLKKLWLAENNIGYEGIRHILKANWSSLTHFSLWSNSLTFQDCKKLLYTDWKHMISLNLLRNQISEREAPWIREMFLFKNQIEIDV